jgi:hypothetical protein
VTATRLSTCGRCGGTIEQRPDNPGTGWGHIVPPANGHLPDPDDSAVSGPDADDLAEESRTAPATLDRAAFDALVQRKCLDLANAAPPSNPEDPATAAEARDAMQEAQLLEAAATEFADAVDRTKGLAGGHVAYEDAVVIIGGAGPIVVTDGDWRANPVYWEAKAAGSTGRVDTLTQGSVLVRYLRGEPDSPAS